MPQSCSVNLSDLARRHAHHVHLGDGQLQGFLSEFTAPSLQGSGIEVQVTYLWNPDSTAVPLELTFLGLVPVGVVSTLLAPLPASSSQKLFSVPSASAVLSSFSNTPRNASLPSSISSFNNYRG